MRVLITGGTGVLGRKLIQKLRQDTNHDVRILIRKQNIEDKKIGQIEKVKGDLRDISSLIRASKGVDTIIHLAAITHTHKVRMYDEVNRSGTENLIHAAEHCGALQFIFLSSRTASYCGGAYAKSKIRAEESLTKSHLNWSIVRPAEVYGLEGNDSIQKIINVVKKGYPLPVMGKGMYTLSPVFVDDVINGIISIMDSHQSARKIYALEGPNEYTFVEMVAVLENQFKKNILKVYLPVFLVKIIAFFLYLLNSDMLYRDQIPRLLCSKYNDGTCSFDDLGIRPRQLEEAITTFLSQAER